MSEKEKKLIKNCDFSTIYFVEENSKLKVYVDGKLKKEMRTIPVYSKTIEAMNDQELFDYVTNLFFETGEIILQREAIIPHFNIKGTIIGNNNGKIMYLSEGNHYINEEFIRQCNHHRFQGITDYVDQELITKPRLNIYINTTETECIYCLDSKQSSSNSPELCLGLKGNVTDNRILNYTIDKFVEANNYNISSLSLTSFDPNDSKGRYLKITANDNFLIVSGNNINNVSLHILNDLTKSVGNKGYQRQLVMGGYTNEK